MFSRYRAGLWLPDEKPMYGARLIKDHPLAKGIVLDTLMNEYGGNIAFDGSGHQNHGTMHNCAWSPRGIDFNPVTTSYINCGNDVSLNITDVITIEAWVKTSNIEQNWQAIGGKQLSYATIIESNTKQPALWLDTGVWTSKARSSEILSQNVWYYIVGTYDGVDAKIYVNGILKDSNSVSGSIHSNITRVVEIGMNGGVYFNGTMRFARIRNLALSQPEISLLHENPYCMYEYPILEQGTVYCPTIMNQFQRANLGADLYDGVLIT